jgi:anti-sigma factor RsiW
MRNGNASRDTDQGAQVTDDTLREMACQDLVEVITDYLEGTLPELERTRFEIHLASCPSCQEYVEQMRALVRLSGKLNARSLESATVDSLLIAFRRWKDSQTGL